MSNQQTGYVSNRVLKINVGFLLNAGPGNSHETAFDVPALRVADDLTLQYLRGPLRLSRTTEGVLVQGRLDCGVTGECFRCLEPVTQDVTVAVEELYALESYRSEFRLFEDAILDLAPLLRAEVLIEASHGFLCRPDCKGLCPTCGVNRNVTQCACEADTIDPRLASLRNFLE